jgi:hypothetical protein
MVIFLPVGTEGYVLLVEIISKIDLRNTFPIVIFCGSILSFGKSSKSLVNIKQTISGSGESVTLKEARSFRQENLSPIN